MVSSISARYVEISQHLIEQAQEELDRGDLMQASEKLWGAAAHAVKALAQERGWNHNRHDLLGDVVEQIADEWDRTDLITLFGSASIMHNNFYEHRMGASRVQVGINDSRTLMGELEALRAEPPRPFTPPRRGISKDACGN